MAHAGGRPTSVTPQVLLKLEEAYSLDCTDAEACLLANIHPSTLYNYQVEHPEFVDRKNELKETPVLKARRAVVGSLNDSDMALKYLERKKKGEFSLRSELAGVDGQPLGVIVLPLMNGTKDSLATNSETDSGVKQIGG